MQMQRVEVIQYRAVDGKLFDNIDKCLAYEREKRSELDYEIHKRRLKIITLKEQANKLRLQFCLAKCDAQIALNGGNKIIFHMKMIEYYKGKVDYGCSKSDLYYNRKVLNELLDQSYLWFGDEKHKSKFAKNERRHKSLRWRQENTPDKWRTPIKIRVSKLLKEDNNG